MPKNGLGQAKLNLDSLSDPGDRFTLGDRLGFGVNGEVFSAVDNDSGINPREVKL